MTKNYHSPLREGEAATVGRMNERLGQLDSQITRNEAGIAANDAVLPSIAWEEQIRGLCQVRMSVSETDPAPPSALTPGNPPATPKRLFFHPYKGNVVGLYNGSNWQAYQINGVLSVEIQPIDFSGLADDTVYDVFFEPDGASIGVVFTAWTNNTTRATALTTQDAVVVQSGAPGRRYIGTIRHSDSANGIFDIPAQRGLFNMYNRVRRQMVMFSDPVTGSWTYDVANVWRAANGQAGNAVSFVIGMQEDIVQANVQVPLSDAGGFSAAGLGLDRTDGNDADFYGTGTFAGHVNIAGAQFRRTVAPGFHFLRWVEHITGTEATFYGAGSARRSMITGLMWG
jgi:hypothetical protein